MTSPTRIMSGDLIDATYEVEFEGRKFNARRFSDRLEFAEASKTEPFGSIKFGSPHSGAIWIGTEPIGEYEFTIEGERSVVTPIVRGQLQPDHMKAVHPVTFLLSSYIQAASAKR